MAEAKNGAKSAGDNAYKHKASNNGDIAEGAEKTEKNGPKAASNDTLEALEAASKGLLFMSESDRPVTPFVWESDKNKNATDALVALIAVTNADKSAVKALAVADFFRNMTDVQDWMSDEEKATAAKFAALVETLEKTLTGAQAFRIEGEPVIDAYVVGKDAAGRWAGVSTQLVET